MPFFELNWIIVFITLLFLLVFIVLESKFNLVSEMIGIKAFKLYLLVLFMGSLSAFLNYIAIIVFGSWEMLIMFIVIALALIFVLGFIIQRKIKQHKEKKRIEKLERENKELHHAEEIREEEALSTYGERGK